MTEQIEFLEQYGYRCCREKILRKIGDERPESLATEAANQIAHLKSSLRELVSIVEIHSKATGENFAWAELDEAKKALDTDSHTSGN